MAWHDGLRVISSSLFRRRQEELELDEEIRFHIERETERHVAAGLSADEARRLAMIDFGGVERYKEEVREVRSWLVDDLARDVRVSLRSLRRNPGFTAVAVLSLALGIGANTAIFSVLHGVVLRPLPYPNSERLVEVWVDWPDFGGPLSEADLLNLSETTTSFAAIGAYDRPSSGFTLATLDGPRLLEGSWLTASMPAVLGVAPLLGRGFASGDEAVALVSHRLWTGSFEASESILGRQLELDGSRFTIIGVMPAGFAMPGATGEDVWPLLELGQPTARRPFYLSAVGRLDHSVALATAHQDLARARTVVEELYPGAASDWRYGARPLRQAVIGRTRTTLWLLMGAVSLVLFIAVGNVANLLLSRSTVRAREMAVRTALGAARGRLVRQLLTESCLLGLLGALAGLGLAYLGVALIADLGAPFIPRMSEVGVNFAVLGFTLAAGLVAGALAGLAPVLQLPPRRVDTTMREGGHSVTGGRRAGRLRQTLVVAEIALALIVVTAAGLLVQSMVRLQEANLGLPSRGLLTFRLMLPRESYGDGLKVGAFIDRLEPRLRSLPAVEGVGFSTSLPPNELRMTNNYTIEGQELEAEGALPTAEWMQASEDYFATLGIPLLRGRAFTTVDRPGTPPVVIVNVAFVRRHFPDQVAVGRRIQSGSFDPEAPWMTIVGVVADVPYESGAAGGINPTVYTAYRQNPWRKAYISIRAAGATTPALVAEIRRVLFEEEPGVPLRDVATMEERVRRSEAPDRFRTLLFGLLAVVGLVLATTGIYGVTAFTVNQRRRETAIEMALGADGRRTLAAVLGQGLRLSGLGVTVGLAGAFLLTRSLSSVLYEVSPLDAITLVGGASLLVIVALAATLVPALEALRTNPATVLRED